jgi:hypothetical protein
LASYNNSAAIDLDVIATRERLTPAAVEGFVRLAKIWRLDSADARHLLGGVPVADWLRIEKKEWPGALSQDTLIRISAAVGIFQDLRQLFSEALADEWVSLPNKGDLFAGRRPLDVMIEGGVPAMIEVRRHIDRLILPGPVVLFETPLDSPTSQPAAKEPSDDNQARPVATESP